MEVDKKTRKIMLNALETNLGYKRGEKVLIIGQRWGPNLPGGERPRMDRAMDLFTALTNTYRDSGIKVFSFSYVPAQIGSTIEPTLDLAVNVWNMRDEEGSPEIILAPTAYSITHTKFIRKRAVVDGSRIATMSDSSLAMFAQRGPFDTERTDSRTIAKTEEIASKLKNSEYVRIVGDHANLTVHIDPILVHTSIGYIHEPGVIENWLGAEVFAVSVDPRNGGKSQGWFSVPAGYGGRDQFEYGVKMFVKNGRIVRVIPLDQSPEAERWLDANLRPMLYREENYNILAGIGFGTNTTIDSAYLEKNWSISVAEKMYHCPDGKRTVHIAHGNTSGMGGRNNVNTHQGFLILGVGPVDFEYTPDLF